MGLAVWTRGLWTLKARACLRSPSTKSFRCRRSRGSETIEILVLVGWMCACRFGVVRLSYCPVLALASLRGLRFRAHSGFERPGYRRCLMGLGCPACRRGLRFGVAPPSLQCRRRIGPGSSSFERGCRRRRRARVSIWRFSWRRRR
jgi:hypothetical protein